MTRALLNSWTLDLAALAPDAPAEAVTRLGEELQRRWEEPWRAYHTTTHLVEVMWALDELEVAAGLAPHDAALARMAAWFHDAVYDPTAVDGGNEAHSAELAAQSLALLGLAEEDVHEVVRLVGLTARHDVAEGDGEGVEGDGVDGDGAAAAFLDADLWILSAPEERFDAYCEQVRAEYAHVPDTAYRQARTAVLSRLMDRETVYATAHARQQWEPRAHRNLAAELDRLRD